MVIVIVSLPSCATDQNLLAINIRRDTLTIQLNCDQLKQNNLVGTIYEAQVSYPVESVNSLFDSYWIGSDEFCRHFTFRRPHKCTLKTVVGNQLSGKKP